MKKEVWLSILAVLVVLAGLLGYAQYRAWSSRVSAELVDAFLSADAKPSWRHELPTTATEVNEWAWADGFLPDYSYHLKARITEKEFREFVARLGLTPHTPARLYSDQTLWLSWEASPQFGDQWWDPADSLAATFVKQEQHSWTLAKFEKGYLYFKALNH